MVDIAKAFLLGNRPIDEVFPSVGSLIGILIPNILGIAAVILFLFILLGGFLFITGAGGSDSKKAEAGKQAITYAVIGFLIIFCAYWIIQIVEKIFGFSIFSPNI